jgi:hypothetical protein
MLGSLGAWELGSLGAWEELNIRLIKIKFYDEKMK